MILVWISLACLPTALYLVEAAPIPSTQTWTYNATTHWAPLFGMDSHHGKHLVELSVQITQLTYGVVEAIDVACLNPSGICKPTGMCHRSLMGAALELRHERFRINADNITRQLAEEEGLLRAAVAMLSAARLDNIERCTDLVQSLLYPGDEECILLITETLNCARGFSELAKESMGLLHAEQIDAVARTHAGIAITRPTSVFDTSYGSDRAEILASLLTSQVRENNEHSSRASGQEVQVMAAEIGVHDGENAAAVLTSVPPLKLFLVDPYEFADQAFFEEYTQYADKMGVGLADELWNRMKPFRNRTVIICQKSSDAAQWVAPQSLDLVFVDGDHEYDAVWDDFRAWRPKLREGGVLAGHDYSLFFPGVIRAVHEFAISTGKTLYLGPDSTFWFNL